MTTSSRRNFLSIAATGSALAASGVELKRQNLIEQNAPTPTAA